jgi:cytoskeletal protein RodZ
MATLQHPTSVRNAIADTVVDLIDAGSAAGKLKFYASNGGSMLAELTFSTTAFGAAASGVATAAAITADSNTSSGTVTWFEVEDSDGNLVFEGDVTDDDTGTGSIQLSSVALGTGDTVSVSSLTYTAPN